MTDDISEKEVLKIAKLSALLIDDNEAKKLTHDLQSILGYIKKLQAIDVSCVSPMSHVQGSTNVFRDDVVTSQMPAATALANCPDTSGHFIRVPIIVEE